MPGPTQDDHARDEQHRLSSESLAALVVDALIEGGVIKKEDAEKAIEIAAEEIQVRKALRDY
jgi:hypothetical protein